MFKQSHRFILASSLSLALAFGNTAFAAETVTQSVIDARQETQIWTTLALNPHLRAYDISVAVLNGRATLTGTVDESVNKELARQIALGVKGVRDVDNRIVVQADAAPAEPTSTRNYAEMVDDANITAAVRSKLMWSKHADDMEVEIDSNRGVVTLKGSADLAAAKTLATRLAASTQGVRSVDNQMRVGMRPATRDQRDDNKPATNANRQEISDTWITAKVKSNFLYSRHLSATRIKVSTRRGVVTLSGEVDSGAERALAIELARNVRGVKRVQARALGLN